MRRLCMVAAIFALVLAACGSGGTSDSATDVGNGAATTMAGMAGMTGGEHAGHGGATASDCSPSGTTVSVVASGTKFNTDCLAAPANQAFTLNYDNKDGLSHNIVFLESHTATDVLFRADIFTGPKMSTFTVPALKAGVYAFHCEVHPSVMMGTLVVK